jgi:hypothetical protein
MAGAVVQALGRAPEFDAARQYVMDKYSWEYAFSLLDGAFVGTCKVADV